jgi:hypothetical protein
MLNSYKPMRMDRNTRSTTATRRLWPCNISGFILQSYETYAEDHVYVPDMQSS